MHDLLAARDLRERGEDLDVEQRRSLIESQEFRRRIVQDDAAKRLALAQSERCQIWPRRSAPRFPASWRTPASRSPGELEITRSTSAVAVCWSSNSRNSARSRAFSMAMTAWLAKFVTNATCFSVRAALPGAIARMRRPDRCQASAPAERCGCRLRARRRSRTDRRYPSSSARRQRGRPAGRHHAAEDGLRAMAGGVCLHAAANRGRDAMRRADPQRVALDADR